ncbi:hypothetical protein GCM10007860_17250 [Chitiniphilus shinanonensis]|uniref:Uncharacterized protein n=1 Tax=Chitiniphilus shinanonensis TaxID=553088 RepID=A0ABQ6BXE6_9NEIS|nr:hypothetical protein [Chitiniphilus shinanonensis]GLS04578.1 hypothetical protein GCM10007860_17250 [Chitiniphilus shinanonensis]
MKKLLLCVLALAFTPVYAADLLVADAPLPFDEPAYAVPVSRPAAPVQARKTVKVASKDTKASRKYAAASKRDAQRYASAKRSKVYAKGKSTKVAKRDVRIERRQYAANTRR